MLEQERKKGLFAVLRQAARNRAAAPARPLQEFEDLAEQRLRDVPAPTWDADTKSFERIGAPLPKPKWDLRRIYDNHGLGHLLSTLKPSYDVAASRSEGWTGSRSASFAGIRLRSFFVFAPRFANAVQNR